MVNKKADAMHMALYKWTAFTFNFCYYDPSLRASNIMVALQYIYANLVGILKNLTDICQRCFCHSIN